MAMLNYYCRQRKKKVKNIHQEYLDITIYHNVCEAIFSTNRSVVKRNGCCVYCTCTEAFKGAASASADLLQHSLCKNTSKARVHLSLLLQYTQLIAMKEKQSIAQASQTQARGCTLFPPTTQQQCRQHNSSITQHELVFSPPTSQHNSSADNKAAA